MQTGADDKNTFEGRVDHPALEESGFARGGNFCFQKAAGFQDRAGLTQDVGARLMEGAADSQSGAGCWSFDRLVGGGDGG